MNTGTQGSSNESSIPTGLSGTVTLNWYGSNIPSYQLISASPTQEITSLISGQNIASEFYPSPVPSLLSTTDSSRSSNSPELLGSSSTSQMSTSDQILSTRSRSRSRDNSLAWSPPMSPVMRRGRPHLNQAEKNKSQEDIENNICLELSKKARKKNDALVYLDGPRVYTCCECRTHLTSHDEIISKSFHGRHGRAYLFDMCVNVSIGPPEDRTLITGLHSVNDIFCKRCKTLIGWTYSQAYEPSQKYKEGKFIIEKIHLHMEENGSYQVNHPAGERRDRWKLRSMSWSDKSASIRTPKPPKSDDSSTIYEYGSRARTRTSSSLGSFSTTNSLSAQTWIEPSLPHAPDL